MREGRELRNMIRDFVAIDFETANQQPSSVCSVGTVMVRDGQIADTFYSLIQPEPNYYSYFCQRVHGITQSDTDDAPVFSKVWQQLEERIVEVFFPDAQDTDDLRQRIAAIPFVAHNARFDEGCLKAAFQVYQMDYPDYRFYDTLTASRRQFGHSLPNHQLHTVAAACGYDLKRHHHALADAEACAAIALYLL
jgi:DNA polymerase-3 subunit epsilon